MKFIPIFDQKPNYPEAEVYTRFQRFVRHFPYIGNLCKQKSTDVARV